MKLERIARHLGCFCGPANADVDIRGIADPRDADERSITFVSDARYLPRVAACGACAVIVRPGCTAALPGKILLEVNDPYLGFALVAQLFEDRSPLFGNTVHPTSFVHPSAQVHPTVCAGPYCVIGEACRIGKGTSLGAHCVIENHSAIGEDCRIDSGAIIRRKCVIGNRVIIQSGAVIGGEGFGNARRENGHWERIPSFGAVIIGDEAEIGANTTIDRGTFSPTIIGKGVKVDNLVMLAHNVVVGDHTAIAAQAGLSGSTTIGKRVMVGGQAGFTGHLTVGDDVFVGAQAGVAKDVDSNKKVTGSPARGLIAQRRTEAAQQQVPGLIKEVKRLKAEIAELRSRLAAE